MKIDKVEKVCFGSCTISTGYFKKEQQYENVIIDNSAGFLFSFPN
jgi:hypothetical protein